PSTSTARRSASSPTWPAAPPAAPPGPSSARDSRTAPRPSALARGLHASRLEAAMRKIIESTLVPLHGVSGDAHLWATAYFDSEAQKCALDLLLASEAMLMGRRTYEFFAATFPHRTGAYGDRVNQMRKYVFSSTLKTADWTNSSIVRGD